MLAGILANEHGAILDDDGGGWGLTQRIGALNSVATRIPLLNFSQQGVAESLGTGDDSDSWWAGVQLCAVSVAIATTLTASALSTNFARIVADQSQDEPPQAAIVFHADEDYQATRVATWQLQNPILLVDPEEIPAATLHGEPDEDYWQNSVASVPSTLLWPQPSQFEQHEQFPQLDTDEDYWQNLFLPVCSGGYRSTSNLPYSPWLLQQDEEFLHIDEDYWLRPVSIPANPPLSKIFSDDDIVAIVPPIQDEDLWVNPVPIAWVYPSLPLLNFSQQGVAESLSADEDYWQNSVVPISTIFTWPQPFSFEQNEVLLIFTAEEDFGKQVVQQSFIVPPKVFIDDEVITSIQFDEDFWANPVVSVPGANLWFQQWLFEQHDPSTLSGQPDEDYWQNRVAPVQLIILWPQQWLFEQNDPGNLSGQLDEDLWLNPTPPAVGSLLYPQQSQFEQNESAGSLFGQYDEDFWSQIQQQLFASLPRIFSDDDVIEPIRDEDYWINSATPIWSYATPSAFRDEDLIVPQPIFLRIDEDFWINSVLPAPLTFGKLYLPDSEEIPATTLHGQLDEDYWQNPIRPIQWLPNLSALQDEDLVVSSLNTDEDLWANWLAAVPATFGKLYLPDVEEIPANALRGQPEEEFWINPVAPVSWNNRALYLPDPEELPVSRLFGQPDEDFRNPAPTIWVYPSLPVLNFSEQGIAKSLDTDEDFWIIPKSQTPYWLAKPFIDEDIIFLLNTDEDYWQNPVAPVLVTLGHLYLPDVEEIPAHTLRGQPDEDYWQNRVAPVAAWPLPVAAFRDDDVITQAAILSLDEDLWQNPIFSKALTFGHLYLPDAEEISAGFLRDTLDEDYWKNAVAPVASSLLWPQQWAFDVQELVFLQGFDDSLQPSLPWGQNWPPLPQVFSDDEVHVTQFLQPDEDYWYTPYQTAQCTTGGIYYFPNMDEAVIAQPTFPAIVNIGSLVNVADVINSFETVNVAEVIDGFETINVAEVVDGIETVNVSEVINSLENVNVSEVVDGGMNDVNVSEVVEDLEL